MIVSRMNSTTDDQRLDTAARLAQLNPSLGGDEYR
jgi:hypothetical protein